MKINISHVAKLANLPINEETAKKLEPQLDATLKHVERLKELDTSRVDPTYQVTGLENIMREDIIAPSLTQEDALKGTTATANGFFVVDAILVED